MPKSNLRFTERDVRRAIRGVAKAGVAVGRVLIDRDGNIAVVAKSGELDSSADSNDFEEFFNGDDKA